MGYFDEEDIEKIEERPDLIEFMKNDEGDKELTYQDTKNNPTTGIGHLITPEEAKTGKIYGQDYKNGLTKEARIDILKKDLKNKVEYLRNIHKEFDVLPRDVQHNLISATFRGTWGLSAKTQDLFKEGKYEEAANEFLRNEEYRSKTTPLQIKKRMERTANAIRSLKGEAVDYPTQPQGEAMAASFPPSADSSNVGNDTKTSYFDPEDVVDTSETSYFDPEDVVEEKISQKDAAIAGAIQGASMGFSDEIGAFLETGKVSGEEYEQAATRRREELKKAEAEWPKTYLASEIGTGILSGFLIPYGAAAKATTTVGKVATTMAISGVEGAVGGLGIAEGTAEEQAKIAGMGALLGATVGGILHGGAIGAKKVMNRYAKPEALTQVEKEAAKDIITTADVVATNNKNIDDIVQESFTSTTKEGDKFLNTDDYLVSGNFFKDSTNLEQDAKDYLYTFMGEEGAEAYTRAMASKKIPKFKKVREQFELTEIPEEEIDAIEKVWEKVDVTSEYNKIRGDVIESTNSSEELTQAAVKYNADIKPADLTDVSTQASNLSEALGLPKIDINDPYTKALYTYRNEMIRFMESVTPPMKGKPKAEKAIDVLDNTREIAQYDESYYKRLSDAFNKQILQGRVNKDSFKQFKYGQYLAEAVEIENNKVAAKLSRDLPSDVMTEKALLRKYESLNLLNKADPMNTMAAKILDMQYVAQLSDDVTGLDLGELVREAHSSLVLKNSFNKEYIDRRLVAEGLMEKEGLTAEKVSEMILKGESSPAVDMYKEMFENLRKELNKAGAQISVQKNYVPMKKKSGAQLILAFEKQHKAMGFEDLTDATKIGDVTVLDIIKATQLSFNKAQKFLEKLPQEGKDIHSFVYLLKDQLDRNIVSVADVNDLMKKGVLRENYSLQKSMGQEVSMAFRKLGDLPDWIREYNISKLVHNYMDVVSTELYVRKTMNKLDQRLPVLRQMGQEKTAQMMTKWKQDMLGSYRDSFANKSSLSRFKYELWAAGKNPMFQAGPELLDVMASSIYPNMIGGSPKAIVRNLYQPLLMTAPELGWWYGSKRVVNAYTKLLRQGYTKSMQDLDRFSLRMKGLDTQSFEGLKNGVSEGTSRFKTTRNVINKYANTVMWAFGKSDDINRFITFEMSKDLSESLLKGGTKGLSKGQSKAFSMLPKSVQNRAMDVLSGRVREGMTSQDDLTELLANYYVSRTQLIYGKASMHELGRDCGPFLTMMTKWPVAVNSEIYYRIQKGDYSRVISKFFGPVVASSVLGSMLLEKDNPRQQALFGSNNLLGNLPASSITSFPDIFVPLNVGSTFNYGKEAMNATVEALSGNWDVRDTRGIQHASKRAVQQYVPVVGGAWRAYENVYMKLMLGEKP